MSEASPGVTIEAAHFYSPTPYKRSYGTEWDKGKIINIPVHQGLLIARSIRTSLAQQNIPFQQILFVDDVDAREQQNQTTDRWRWELFIQRPLQQIRYDEKDIKIYEEHEFIYPARELILRLKEETIKTPNSRMSEDGKSIIFGTGKRRQYIRLTGYKGRLYGDEYPDLPSCEVLDLCAYRKRLSEMEETVTILPLSFKPQQDRVRKLFELLQEDAKVTVGYHDEEGRIVQVDQWHAQHTPTSDKIAEIVAGSSIKVA